MLSTGQAHCRRSPNAGGCLFFISWGSGMLGTSSWRWASWVGGRLDNAQLPSPWWPCELTQLSAPRGRTLGPLGPAPHVRAGLPPHTRWSGPLPSIFSDRVPLHSSPVSGPLGSRPSLLLACRVSLGLNPGSERSLSQLPLFFRALGVLGILCKRYTYGFC